MSRHFVVLNKFPAYRIYEDGHVVRIKKRSQKDHYKLPYTIKSFINRYGYIEYFLFDKSWDRRHKAQHRLIAEAFIPNPEAKPQVNHINGIKTDNRLCNLEWCTCSENELHSYRVLGKKSFRSAKGKIGYAYPGGTHPVVQISLDGVVLKKWFSPSVAAIEDGFSIKQISAVCTGRQKTHGGYVWKYV